MAGREDARRCSAKAASYGDLDASQPRARGDAEDRGRRIFPRSCSASRALRAFEWPVWRPNGIRTSMKILARYSLLGFLLVACASETPQDVLGVPPAPEPGEPIVEAPPPPTPTPEPPKKDITPACTPDVPRTVPLQVAVQPEAGTTPFSPIIAS